MCSVQDLVDNGQYMCPVGDVVYDSLREGLSKMNETARAVDVDELETVKQDSLPVSVNSEQ